MSSDPYFDSGAVAIDPDADPEVSPQVPSTPMRDFRWNERFQKLVENLDHKVLPLPHGTPPTLPSYSTTQVFQRFRSRYSLKTFFVHFDLPVAQQTERQSRKPRFDGRVWRPREAGVGFRLLRAAVWPYHYHGAWPIRRSKNH